MIFIDRKNEQVKAIERLNKPHKGPKLAKLTGGDAIIEVSNATKAYANGTVISNVLKGVSLKIYDGEFIVVLGPSGSGKTTLMNIISGLDRATDGEVKVLGNNLINMNDDELTKFRRINVGYIFQQYGLIPNLKVKENIAVGSYLNDLNKKEIDKNLKYELDLLKQQQKAEQDDIISFEDYVKQINKFLKISEFDEYVTFSRNFLDEVSFAQLWNVTYNTLGKTYLIAHIDTQYKLWQKEIEKKYQTFADTELSETIDDIMQTLGIYEIRNKYPSQLSGGQQQRVSIARVFAKHPRILFADEPTGAVDNTMSDIILDAFVQINKKYKITIMIVTHNPEIAKLATKIINFKDGLIDSVVEQKPHLN